MTNYTKGVMEQSQKERDIREFTESTQDALNKLNARALELGFKPAQPVKVRAPKPKWLRYLPLIWGGPVAALAVPVFCRLVMRLCSVEAKPDLLSGVFIASCVVFGTLTTIGLVIYVVIVADKDIA